MGSPTVTHDDQPASPLAIWVAPLRLRLKYPYPTGAPHG